MTEPILHLYNYMKAHKLVAVLSFMIVTLLLVVSVLRLGYKEDIAELSAC